MSQATAPKISILGDGISTFEGYTPRLGSFYSPSYVSYSGFDSAEGTWWMQAIKKLGGQRSLQQLLFRVLCKLPRPLCRDAAGADSQSGHGRGQP